jgi:hypothetical protein
LLAHADCFMRPTWLSGGLYYPRNDQLEDELGNRVLMEPHTGNVLLSYARLNVPDGLWRLYNEPLSAQFFENTALTEVGLDVELHRAFYDETTLTFTAELLPVSQARGDIEIGRLPVGRPWILRCDGREVARGEGSKVEKSSRLDLRGVGEAIVLTCPADGVHDFTLALA